MGRREDRAMDAAIARGAHDLAWTASDDLRHLKDKVEVIERKLYWRDEELEAKARRLTTEVDRLTSQVAELQKQLRDHHDFVPIQDPRSTWMIERYFIYRGTDARGRRINEVRDEASRCSTYVITDPAAAVEDALR